VSGRVVDVDEEPARDGHTNHVERLRLMDDAMQILSSAFVKFDIWMTSSDAVKHMRGHGKKLLEMADRIERFSRRKVR
jgi:hypothetical protein